MVAAGALLGAGAVGALKATANVMAVTHVFFKGCRMLSPLVQQFI